MENEVASVHWEERFEKQSPEPLHQESSGQERSESEWAFATALPVEITIHRHTSFSHHVTRKKGLGIYLVFQIFVKHFHPRQLSESRCVVGNEVFVVKGVEGSPAPQVAQTSRRCRGAWGGLCQRDRV